MAVRVRVIDGFPHAADGRRTKWVEPGADIDVEEALLEGLLARRLVERPPGTAETKILAGAPDKKHRRG